MDPWYKRFQFEIGIRFDLNWASIGFRKWLFDPYAGLTLIGQKLDPGLSRSSVPNEAVHKSLHTFDTGEISDGGLRITHFISDCFWLRGAIRICGFDLGAGFYYRRNWGA